MRVQINNNNSNMHWKQMLSCVLADGGEGIVLRRQRSVYTQGRAPTLLKLKVIIIMKYHKSNGY